MTRRRKTRKGDLFNRIVLGKRTVLPAGRPDRCATCGRLLCSCSDADWKGQS